MIRTKLIEKVGTDGKITFTTGKAEKVPQKEIDNAMNIIKASKAFIKRISIIDFNKLNKKFNI